MIEKRHIIIENVQYICIDTRSIHILLENFNVILRVFNRDL